MFPQLFFPSADPTVAIVASLATYGVGYVARPIGAFVLGHLGDTHGRKNVLLVCMFMMGFSTMAVGLLPTYAQVGVLAPVLLVVLRLIQGFAVAGEISGSSLDDPRTRAVRPARLLRQLHPAGRAGRADPRRRRVPAARHASCRRTHSSSWGWRIPFLLSVVVIIAGYIIRREVEETPAFAEEGAQGADRRTRRSRRRSG